MTRKTFLIAAAVAILSAVIGGLVRHRSANDVSGISDMQALGLHGTTKLSRPLSKTQAERLKEHFLDIPGSNAIPAGAGSVRQVQAINRLNERQSK